MLSVRLFTHYLCKRHVVQRALLGGATSQGRLSLSYTCKVCGTRQGPKFFTKKAYDEGVVIVTCDCCKKHHLIADNLGWFPQSDGLRNIEMILKEKGEVIKRAVDLVDVAN